VERSKDGAGGPPQRHQQRKTEEIMPAVAATVLGRTAGIRLDEADGPPGTMPAAGKGRVSARARASSLPHSQLVPKVLCCGASHATPQPSPHTLK